MRGADKAKELVQEYARREPDAVTLVHELLARANSSMDDLVADALAENLDYIERIDRLTTIAESRRNDQPARDRSASGGPRRSTATERASGRGWRV